MKQWALDLGTTNTGLAAWDESLGRPRFQRLSRVCRKPAAEDPLEAPSVVPSATEARAPRSLADRLGRWRPLQRWILLGQQAWIGREAVERNVVADRPAFAPSFKRHLARDPLRTVARLGRRPLSAREVARLFMGELFRQVRSEGNRPIRDLTITVPVEAYETYRAELRAIATELGVKRLRFLDEPVAAALGYGLGAARDRCVLVVDFGGGTLDLALVRLRPRDVEAGLARVIAKAGRPIGGDLVDTWLLERFCQRAGYPLSPTTSHPDELFWYRLMLAEARTLKERLFFEERAVVSMAPPEDLRSFEARLEGDDPFRYEMSRQDLIDVLREGHLYDSLEECLGAIVEQASARDLDQGDIDEVLMVGGSTLLPGVYEIFERIFGRDRVRAWQPFEAVAYGAAVFAAGVYSPSDFIIHDYAFVTYDLETNEPQYTVVVPAGTRFPTPPDLWQRQLTPTCSLGEPETIFKLVICEVGRARDGDRVFSRDAAGRLVKLGGGDEEPLIVPLNASNPTLGYLDPPHIPGDHRPRLDVAFGVNADRWLCTTVRDLRTGKVLMDDMPVVRLL